MGQTLKNANIEKRERETEKGRGKERKEEGETERQTDRKKEEQKNRKRQACMEDGAVHTCIHPGREIVY